MSPNQLIPIKNPELGGGFGFYCGVSLALTVNLEKIKRHYSLDSYQLPLKTGGLFSMKALKASIRSSEGKTVAFF